MEEKVLGIDLGTNSIGLSVRDKSKSGTVADQLDFFTSVIFNEGTGRDSKGKIASLAAERTKHRSSRRLNQARRYRIWRTLEVLIKYGYCPLTEKELDRWRKYDKGAAVKRQYPIENDKFEQWVRLDFNLDGTPDYTSPYQLRAELAETRLDMTQQINRFKLGRALYHIAQRRGFKSSKGETLNEMEKEATEKNTEVQEVDMDVALKLSEKKKSSGLRKYIDENNCKTAGAAFAKMEREGIRIRNNGEFQAVRDLYEKEVRAILEMQGIEADKEFGLEILSRKKNEGSIFYKRPLRSQKGTVGKCTLEPSKSRCPMSRPEFEEFRAWALINNIKYRLGEDEEYSPLDLEIKRRLFNTVFTRSVRTFKFADVEKFLRKEFSETGKVLYLNYKNNTTVSGCPVINKIKQLLGDDWKTATLSGHTSRGKEEVKQYNYEELWHVCFEADDAEDVTEFCVEHLDEDISAVMVRLWSAMGEGYANLSLKAINNINRLLQEGYIYSDAVLWAKVADIIGTENWKNNKDTMLDAYDVLRENVEFENICSRIANNVITNYRMLPDEQKFALHDTSYLMDDDDRKDVRRFSEEMFGKRVWKEKSEEERRRITDRVEELYQGFFADAERKMVKVPKLTNAIGEFIEEHFGDKIQEGYRGKALSDVLYHPSAIDIYPKAKYKDYNHNGNLLSLRLLESPATNVFRNPMVMRVLHQLRRQINNLLIEGVIDERTRVVVETAREFNDANVRAAIEKYQKAKEEENAKFRKRLEELFPTLVVNDDKIQRVRLLMDQALLDEECENLTALTVKSEKRKFKDSQFKVDMTKYELWLEQHCRSIYTGRVIPLSKLFDETQYDIEHTIPRSICFDDSLTNKTICEASFNREVKKNMMPTQMANYDEIVSRIQPWIKRRDEIKELVGFWKGEAKKASTPDRKSQCIVQRHLWEMELDYWTKKVANFTKESDNVSDGFRNSQLVDTRIITKYAMHFLKSVFNRVDVQRGEMTASFRKAFGIQEIYEKKSRDRHSHHAIDATMLTLIPTNQQRDSILQIFYEIEEAKALGNPHEALDEKLEKLKERNGIKNVSEVNRFIEENILIRHTSRDQALQPARKRIRVRGKIKKFENGEVRYATGDCIRGQLHKESYYGAITQFEQNEEGKNIPGKKLYYVKRRDLKFKANAKDSGFKDWNDLEKAIVNKELIPMMKSQYPDKSFKEAIAEGLYMLDSEGNRINRIRHIRCYESVTNPVRIKEQVYKSDKEYKNYLLAASADIHALCRYVNFKGKTVCKVYRLYDIAENRKMGFEDIPSSFTDEHGIIYKLVEALKSGLHILLYKERPEEVKEMNPKDMLKRLYVLPNAAFESDGRIHLLKHNCALPDKQLGMGEKIEDFENLPNKIRCTANGLKYLLEGRDFEITTKGIEFK